MSDLERFWARVDQTGGADACWPWTRGRFANQYGTFRVDGANKRAHRWLLGALRGAALRSDELACHRCDNPPCCNPSHLFIGSAADNSRDMAAKGRSGGQRKTHCPSGHAYTPDNVYISQGSRNCRTCKLERERVPGAIQPADRTHCPKGHPYDEANTYQYGSNRYCRACNRESAQARRARRRTEMSN